MAEIPDTGATPTTTTSTSSAVTTLREKIIAAEEAMFAQDRTFAGTPYVSVFAVTESGGDKWKGQAATTALTRRYRLSCADYDAGVDEIASGVMRPSDRRIVFYLEDGQSKPEESDLVTLESNSGTDEYRITTIRYETDSSRVELVVSRLSEQEDDEY